MKSILRNLLSARGNGGYERLGQQVDVILDKDGIYRQVRRKSKLPWINIVLFILTILTTLMAGTMLEGENPLVDIRNLRSGIPFAFTLMAILTVHEFGHFILARYHGLKVTYPYFIPVPMSLVGTFGAIIRIKSPIMNKRALLDIGSAGPIAGFLIALPALYFGLQASEVKMVAEEGALHLGNSILMSLMQFLIFGNIPVGFDIYLNSVAFAGWFGLLVTAVNLLPLGQLDGGHILYALAGTRQFTVARILLVGMIILGFSWKGWWLWAVLIYFMRFKHPPTADEHIPLDRKRIIIGLICLGIFIVCFIPIPFKII